MPEALLYQCEGVVDWTADAAYSAGAVVQLPDGRAGVVTVDVESGKPVGVAVKGIYKITKTASQSWLPGGQVFWDHSADAGHYKKVNDRDFYVGVATEDAAYAATVGYVDLNVKPAWDIDVIGRDGALSVTSGTAAAGGFGLPVKYGAALGMSLTATSEVQKVDVLSVDRFAIASEFIAEAVIRLENNGSTSAVDINVGVANGTHATDADSITEHVFFHIDGGALDILAQSKDGTTTVAAADTTVDATAGAAVANRFEFWIDGRDSADVKLYVNGARVLSGSTFKLNAGTGPLGLLAHMEKTTGTATAGPLYLDRLCVRYRQ